MRGCDNSKIHISSNSLLSIRLLIMLDTLLLVPSLHCNTSLHLTTLHHTTLHYPYRHFTSSELHFTILPFGLTNLHFLSFYFTPITKRDTVRFSHSQTYLQNNEPLHCPKEILYISLNFTYIFSLFIYFSLILSTLHFTLLCYSHLQQTSLHFACLQFLLFIAFTSPLFCIYITVVLKM
jgi:hypothetical protein